MTTEKETPAANNAHSADALTEHAKIIVAKEAKKAKAVLSKTSLRPQSPTSTGTQQDPTQTELQDPEILLEVEDTTTRVTTPKGDVADASLDFTLSEEEEGDNISGNKKLRATKHKDETNLERLKTPLHTPTTE
jgi:hypothetical protein